MWKWVNDNYATPSEEILHPNRVWGRTPQVQKPVGKSVDKKQPANLLIGPLILKAYP